MSNAFETFRKNRNFWMAGLVLLALLAFVVAPAIETMTQGMGGGGAAANAVVVRWDGGKFSMRDLQSNMQMHGRLVRFLLNLAQEVIKRNGRPQVPGFLTDPQSGQIYSLGIQGTTNEMSVTHTRILADHARRMGVNFSDESADDFLRSFCDDKLTGEEVQKILADSGDGMLSFYDVRELIKEQMLAKVAMQMAAGSVETQPPGQIWEGFLKLTQTAKVEAFPVFVEEYLDDVTGEPTDEEIQAIYDEGIMRAQNTSTYEPAFLRRPKGSAEYIQADLDAWTEKEKAKLTVEDLQAEYDRRLSLGQLQVPVAATEPTESPGAEGAETMEAPATGDAPADATNSATTIDEPAKTSIDPAAPADESSATSTEPARQEPARQEPAVEETTPANAPTADAPATGTEATANEATGTEATATASGTSVEPPATDQSLNDTIGSAGRLVSFQQEAQTPPPVVQPPQLGDAAGDAAATDTPPNGAQEPAIEPSQTEESGATATETEATSGTPQATGGSQPSSPPATRPQTFEEAREKIATELAMERARPAMNAALQNFQDQQMLPYSTNYRAYISIRDSSVKIEDQGDPPIKPNLKKFAEENNFVYGETGLVDGSELGKTQFGLSFFQQQQQTVLIANALPSAAFPALTPFESTYFDQAALFSGGDPQFLQFLFWKLDQRPAYAPDLEEIRAEVVEYWKLQQATKLAVAEAEKLAARIKAGDEAPWASALSETERALVVETEPFTWMSRQTGISVVPKLDNVGPEFMEAVFSTPAGRVGAAPNANHSKVYAFVVTELGPPQEELQQRFNADPLKSGPIELARSEAQEIKTAWFQNLLKEYNLVWEIPLEQLMAGDE